MNRFEHWVWTELVAFDVDKPDCGAAEYLDTLGFVPEGLCLLMTSPDFIMSHTDLAEERPFPPDFCSRNGHPGNEIRNRQVWTNWRLQTLIRKLTERGCQVYCSVFNGYLLDQFHHEWVSDHPEVRGVFSFYDGDPQGRGTDISLVKKLSDGTPVADLFSQRLVRCCIDYGFAGFHGADGCGPWWASASETDMSDSFLQDFLQPEWDLPDFLRPPWDGKMTTLQERSRWIWAHRRLEWIDFLTGTWCTLWRQICTRLHSAGLKAIINSANTRACFDALYETGIDYRKMADLGIDAMVVETVALGIELTHPESPAHHDDFPTALQEIRAVCPEWKLIFLHGIKDVVENWDNLRQAPGAYERELYRLTNSYLWNGTCLERAARGLLACLADGISAAEWDYIRNVWQRLGADSETLLPLEAGEAAAFFTPALYTRGVADYTRDGFPPAHDQIRTLVERGFHIETAAKLSDAANYPGVRIIPGVHLLDDQVLEQLVSMPGMTAFCGRAQALEKYLHLGQSVSDGRITLLLLGSGTKQPRLLAAGTRTWKDAELCVRFCEYRERMEITDEFWKEAVSILHQAALDNQQQRQLPTVELLDQRFCSLSYRRLPGNILQISLENRAVWRRCVASIRVSQPVSKVQMLTRFPIRPEIRENGHTLTFPVPPHGITVANLEL